MTTKITGSMIDATTVAAANVAADVATQAELDAVVAPGAITAAMLEDPLDLTGKTLTLPPANTPAFTKTYTSADQTVTAAGALTLAHGLGAVPALVQCRLKCVTAELGYSIGNEVVVNPGPAYVSSSTGLSVVLDATNVVIRFGSSGGGVAVVRKDTGALAIITAANWSLIVKAWA